MDSALVNRLESKMYNFSVLVRQSDATLERLVEEADQDLLATALKGADAELMDRLYGTMPKRAAQYLREAIEAKAACVSARWKRPVNSWCSCYAPWPSKARWNCSCSMSRWWNDEKRSAVPIFSPGLGEFRNYRYPPLVTATEDDLFGDDGGSSYQDEFNNGFQDGLQKGHEQGYQDGVNQGLQVGQRDGHEQGRQQGLQEGRLQAQQHVAGVLQASGHLKDQIQQAFHHHVQQQSEMLCDLVMKVTRQVIRAELTLQPGQMVNLIEETLQQLPEHKPDLTVYLNPQDSQRLLELVPDQVAQWNVQQDESLTIGSCRVVTADSEALVDSEERLAACMDVVKDTLLADA
ncbi:flagellar assembly protein FliH [Photobacterium aphoticum]|uniref:Flagellar assembly protein FliH n=1 Tax=Photobacterium aphoticum TaxID=754436 RepID=A0A090RIH1_9GAMM|nr:flagellar assembly protein FliH [Photobacterium aphoticum]